MLELQKKNWPYFIKKVVKLSEREKIYFDEFDGHDGGLLLEVVSNLHILKYF